VKSGENLQRPTINHARNQNEKDRKQEFAFLRNVG
jgi:hypothetical protein